MKKENSFLNNYFSELQKIINPEKKTNEKIILFKKYCLEIKKIKKRFLFLVMVVVRLLQATLQQI